MIRRRGDDLEVFLVHPGGPFWAKKDFGAWSIPKGVISEGEVALEAAKREFQEETGFLPGSSTFVSLGEVKQAGAKQLVAWAFTGDCDPAKLISNTCQIEWPPRSGRTMEIPEVDRGAWFSLAEARDRISKGQLPFLDRLQKVVLTPGSIVCLRISFMSDCLFCKIASTEIPVLVLDQDEQVFAFPDINPQAPAHFLVIPKQHFADVTEVPAELLGHLLHVAGKLAKEKLPGGHRIVINTGEDAGQSVAHVHLHVLGGRAMHWPPG